MSTVTEKKRYLIEFKYDDNGQIYTDDVLLTDEEFERVDKFLYELWWHDDILPTNEEDKWLDCCRGKLIWEIPVQTEPDTFEGLQKRWTEGCLVAKGRQHEVEL